MRWTPGRRSPNLEDRRGSSGGFPGGGIGKFGLGGTVLLVILSLVFGQDLTGVLNGGGGSGAPPQVTERPGEVASTPEEDRLVQFVSFVLDDVQQTWGKLFAADGKQYREAVLVLFRDATQTACGFGQAATGPFYCPGDQRVYIDLGFYDELHGRFGAPGDFAQAYVLAHEVGHHVQNIFGTNQEVHRLQQANPRAANSLSVRLELQADCYAGVWGYYAAQRQILERGDAEEGLAAAAAVGDDRMQRNSSRRVNPDAFTHGTSEQRMTWFQRGLQSGRPDSCNTFDQ